MGFEPTLEFPLNTLSKRAPSATRPPLRADGKLHGPQFAGLMSAPGRANVPIVTYLAAFVAPPDAVRIARSYSLVPDPHPPAHSSKVSRAKGASTKSGYFEVAHAGSRCLHGNVKTTSSNRRQKWGASEHVHHASKGKRLGPFFNEIGPSRTDRYCSRFIASKP